MYLKKLLNTQLVFNEKGIGLVEVMAAFSISIVVITSLVSLALYTVRSSLNSKLLLEGTKIANRELERVRAYRDTRLDWSTFTNDLDLGSGGLDCTCPDSVSCTGAGLKQCSMILSPTLDVVEGTAVETIDGQPVTYYFNVTPDPNDPNNIVRVTVEVSWRVGGQNKYTHVYTDLSNWNFD